MKLYQENNKLDLWVMLAFATIYIVWGSTYFFIQVAMQSFPPLLLGALRFCIAGILMFTWCIIKKEKIFDLSGVLNSAIIGSLLLAGGNGAVVLGEKTIPSAVVAILWASQPLSFVLIDYSNWRKNFQNKSTLWGLIVGFFGVLLLFSDQIVYLINGRTFHYQSWGLVLLIGGTLAFSIGSLYGKTHPSKFTPAVNVAWQMVTAGVLFVIGSILSHETDSMYWDKISRRSWLSLGYLIVFGSIAAFSAYVYLLSVRPVTKVSTYAYVNPIVAVILGYFIANEKITNWQLLGLLIILISVLMINLNKYFSKVLK